MLSEEIGISSKISYMAQLDNKSFILNIYAILNICHIKYKMSVDTLNLIKLKYEHLRNTPSDINEHLQTLHDLATECESVLELGVRGVVSSWSLVYGLLNNNKEKKYILLNDLNSCDISELLKAVDGLDIEVEYQWMNDLELELDRNVDLVFIDTWHVYGQLKRELDKFSKVSNKYIVMHDTTVDEIFGETIRMCLNAEAQSRETGIPIEEINKGLWPAVEEFLSENANWHIKKRYTNNNGLTILERV